MTPHTSKLRATLRECGFLAVALPLLAALLFLPDPARAQLVTGRFVTSVYTWEKFDTVNTSTTYLRGFQNLQLAVAQGDISFHTYLQGAINSDGGTGLVRAYNLYLRWANIGKLFDLNVGRHGVYSGVGYGTIDGASAKLHLFKNKLSVFAYGGATPSGEYAGISKDYSENLNFGGQILTTAIPYFQLGLSYMNRREQRESYWTQRARDASYTLVPYQITFEPESQELIGGDALFTYRELVSVYGRYDYDLANDHPSRAQLSVRVNVTPKLTVTLDDLYRLPRTSYNSIFSAFTQNSTDELEMGVEYEFLPRVRAFARGANIQFVDESSKRWTVGVNTGYGVLSYSGSSGYVGQLQSVTLYGNYPLLGNTIIPSLGVMFSSYRLSELDDRESALSFVFGGTWRPARAFSMDVQGQWLTNQIYARDLRGMLKLNYWFAERLSLFGQEAN
jgi:hypothetical protein